MEGEDKEVGSVTVLSYSLKGKEFYYYNGTNPQDDKVEVIHLVQNRNTVDSTRLCFISLV